MSKLKCGYLGPAGTFTEEAALKYFGNSIRLVPLNSINKVFAKIKNLDLHRGVVPVENSLEGPVNMTMDLLFSEDGIEIVGEEVLPIRHFLITAPGVEIEQIKQIYSHPQAIAQSGSFIREKLPEVRLVSVESTAVAAAQVQDSFDRALIGSKRISTIYNLEIKAENIQDYKYNYTRFLIIGFKAIKDNMNFLSGEPELYNHKNASEYKTSIICAPQVNKAGVLYEMLGEFARESINLTRIESRPTKKYLGEYLFYIDFTGHGDESHVLRALTGIKSKSIIFKNLGSYLKTKEGSIKENVKT